VSAVSFAVFVIYETRTKYPILDFKLFKIKEFTGGCVAQLLNAVAWGGVMLLLSLYLELVQGYSALDAGIRLIPFEVVFLIFGPLSGRASDRLGQRTFIISGLAVTSLSLFLLYTIGVNTPYSNVALYMSILGAGTGMFSSPNMSAVMGSVPAMERGVASAVRGIFFNIGAVISLNLAIVIMAATCPYSLISYIIVSLNPILPTVDRVLFAKALSQAFLWMGVVNTAAIVPSLLWRKSSKIQETKQIGDFYE
jgi:MFS family permease